MEELKLWDLVVVINGNGAEIGRVVGIDEVARLGSAKLKSIKYKYHIKYSGASEGFYKNGRKIKKLNEWQADVIKREETFRF